MAALTGGIIPASAGNTYYGNKMRLGCEDHPRIRGEHAVTSFGDVDKQGSSPHPRGTLLRADARKRYFGIIPASAGNTSKASAWRTCMQDHPRIRGEHTKKIP